MGMKTWTMEQIGEWTCPKCGSVYAISATRYPARDSGQISCDCGEKIHSWSGTTDFDKLFVHKGDPKDAVKNPKFE